MFKAKDKSVGKAFAPKENNVRGLRLLKQSISLERRIPLLQINPCGGRKNLKCGC